MHTFNLGLVFGQAEEVIILVCASEEPIDRLTVNRVATKSFRQGLTLYRTLEQVITHTVQGITEECGCNVVTVTADCACMIPRKK